MLIKKLTRYKRKEVKLFFFRLFASLLFPQLVVEHFLVVKEKELVLEDLRAAHFGLALDLVPILDFVEEVFVLVNLHTSLLLLLDDVLTHLLQVVLKKLLVSHLVSKSDSLAEAK